MSTIKKLHIIVAVLLCSVTANAYDFEVDGIYYNVIDATNNAVEVVFDNYGKSYAGNVIIPESVTFNDKTYKVTSIGCDAFAKCAKLTSIRIPSSVTNIKNYSFYGCSLLTNIEIPNSVTEIGYNAFDSCTSLTKAIIGNGVKSIFQCAFANCTSLKSVILGNNVSEIWDSAFKGCTNITSITIPNNITYIEGTAFLGCNGLKKVEVNCKTIGSWFANSYIEEVIIGNSVASIGYDAFYGCSRLTSIVIGNSVTSIGRNAFAGCSGLTSINLLGDTPPTVERGNFTESQYVNIILYVPVGSLETYQNADTWKNFWNIQEFDATGIDDVNVNYIAIKATANRITLSDADGKAVAIYTANGTRIANIDSYNGEDIILDKGVYIVQVGNKTIKIKL